MADEAMLSVPGLGKLDYTLKHYMAYASKLQDKVKQLNALGEIGHGKLPQLSQSLCVQR